MEDPAQRHAGRLKSICVAVVRGIHYVALRGSGCDVKLLKEYGSDKCVTRAASAGYANLSASTLGAAGAMWKTTTAIGGMSGLAAGVFVGTLYWSGIWNLERALAANIDPFWPTGTKLKAFAARAVVSLVTATFQAAPWALLVLSADIDGRLHRFELQERLEARATLEQLHNLRGTGERTLVLSRASNDADGQIWILPDTVIDAKQLADKCDKDADALLAANKKKAVALQAKLPALSNIELSSTATAAQKSAAQHERQRIQTRINRLADEVAGKQAECRTAHAQATDAQKRYVADAETKSARARADLDLQRKSQEVVQRMFDHDVAKATEAARTANAPNSGAQIKAAIALLREDTRAQVIFGALLLWFWLLDIATSALKLIASPGDYDQEIRVRQALKGKAVEHRIWQADEDEQLEKAEAEARVAAAKKLLETEGEELFVAAQRRTLQAMAAQRENQTDLKSALEEIKYLEAVGAQAERARKVLQDVPHLTKRLDMILSRLARA